MTKFQLIFRSRPVTFMGYSCIPGEGATTLYGLYRYVRSQRVHGFAVVLVINGVSVLAILVIIRV